MAEKLTYQDFAKRIKEKYPQYNSLDDSTLTAKLLEKYPQYKETVDTGFMSPDLSNPIKTENVQTQFLADPNIPKEQTVSSKEIQAPEDSSETVKALKSSSARALGGVMGLPSFLIDQVTALTIKPIMKGIGYSDAEIEGVRTAAKAAPMMGQPAFATQSAETQEQLNQYAKGLENTMTQYENGIIGSIQEGNYSDAGEQLWLGAVQSLPYLAMTVATSGGGTPAVLSTIGLTASAQRYGELQDAESEEGKKLSETGKFANSWLYGGFEAAGELVTMGLANTAKGVLKNIGKEAADGVKDGIVKATLKGFGLEGSSEAATELGQQISDYTMDLRDNIDFKAIVDAALIGGVTGAGISGTPTAVAKLAGRKIATDKDIATVNENNAKIVDLTVEKENTTVPEAVEVIDTEIQKAADENNKIINDNIEKATNLTPEEIIKVKDLDDAISTYENRIANATEKDNVPLMEQIKKKLISDKEAFVKEAIKSKKITPIEDTPAKVIEFTGDELKTNTKQDGSNGTESGNGISERIVNDGTAKMQKGEVQEQQKFDEQNVEPTVKTEQTGGKEGKADKTDAEAEVEIKKADIEKRRQEELKTKTIDVATAEEVLDYLTKNNNSLTNAINSLSDNAINLLKTRMGKLTRRNSEGTVFKKLVTDTGLFRRIEEGVINRKPISEKEINAKYDAELKSLSTAKTAITVKSETQKKDTEKKSKSSETQPTETKQVTKQLTKSETVKPLKQKEFTKEPFEMTRDEYVSPRVTELLEKSPFYLNSSNIKWKQQERKNAESKATDEWMQANEKAFIEGKKVKDIPAWALTAKQWAERSDDTLDSYIIDSHRKLVKQAIKDGKPIPKSVKKEYPELFEEKKPTEDDKGHSSMSVGDIVYMEDINDSNHRFPVNFRGWHGDLAIVIFDGSQMSMTKDRIFKNDVSKTKKVSVTKPIKELPSSKVFTKVTKALNLTGKETVSMLGKTARNGKINGVDIVVQQGNSDNEIIIESMRTPSSFRQKGKATKALQTITEQADKENITLKLRAVPQKGAKITEAQLKSFYEKNGFEFDGIEGTRKPKDLQAESQKKISTINRLIDDARYYDQIQNNHTTKKANAGNDLQKLANRIGYSIGKDSKGNTTVFDENKKPVTKKIAVRETQEDIQAHKTLNEYTDKNFINNVNKLISNSVYLNGIRLYGLKPSEIAQGIKNILDGKKTVAANNLLDALEEAYKVNEVGFQDGSGVPFDKLIESIGNESTVEYSPLDNIPERIIDKINSGEGLNNTDIRELEDAFISNEQIEELKELSDERQSEIERENRESETGISAQESGEKAETAVQQITEPKFDKKQAKIDSELKRLQDDVEYSEIQLENAQEDLEIVKGTLKNLKQSDEWKNADKDERYSLKEDAEEQVDFAKEEVDNKKAELKDAKRALTKFENKQVFKQSKSTEDGQKERQGQGRQEVLTPTEEKVTPKQKAEAAKAKIAQGFSDLADLIGAKKSLTGEQRESAIKAIQRIIEGLIELGIAKGMSLKDAVLNYAKDNKFTVPEDLVDEAITRIQPKFTEQYPIGTTNAKVRTSREMRGLDAIPKADRVANKDLWQSVVDKIANGIIIPRQTVKDILSTPIIELETNPTKEAIVKWDRIRILKETKYTVAEIEAKQQANDNTGLVDLFLRKSELEIELQQNDLAAERLGNVGGSTMQFRQRNLEEDMSLAAIIREAQILNGGKKLTALQEKKFKELSDKFEALQAEYDKLKAESEQKQEQSKADEEKKRKAAEKKLINDIQNKLIQQTPKAMRDFDTQFKADIKKQKLTEKEQTLKERLKERLGRLASLQFAVGEEGSAMIIEELSGVIKDMSELGIIKLEQGIDRIISKVKDYMMSVDKKFDGKNLDKYKDEIGKTLGINKVVDGEYERLINKLVDVSQLGFDTGIKGILNEIVYNRVVSGRDTIDDVVDDIYESVKNRIPNIDKRKIRDAISGYGEFRKLSKEETDTKVRELKRQGRLDSAIEDVETKNQLPLRTGVERDVQTQQTRQKQARILKEIKERDLVPPPTADEQETQWRNGLQAYKRRLENAIEDIQKEIATGERKAKSQPKKYTSPELESLKTELERLKKVREAIDKESGKYVEQRESAIIKATERAIAELEMDIDKLRQGLATDKNVTVKGKNVFGLSKPAKEKIISDRITELQNLKDGLQQQLSDLLPDAIKDKALLEKYKKQRERRLEQLREQQRTKDYGERQKPYRPPLDKATVDINRKIERIKYDIEKEKEQIRLDNRTWKERMGESVLNAWNLPKALMASIDLSAPFRQGIVMVSKPKLFGKAFKEMFVYAFSKNAYEDWLFDLKATDAYYEMIENGLYIAEPTAKLAAKEENFMSNWLRYVDKIPLYGAFRSGSERAYIGFLNKLRIDVYLNFKNKLEKEGLTKDEITEELKSYSHFVNTATGRGKLSMKFGQKEVFTLEGVAPVLNSVFFSPRLIASRLAAFNPAFYANMSSRTRKDAIKTYLGSAGIIMSTLALAAIAFYDDDNFEIELDPRSSNFLKIRYGNIYYDLWGGHQQVARSLAQVITGQVKTDGKVQKMEGDKWYGQTRASVLTKFFSNKLSPSAALIKDILQGGKNYDGEDLTVTGELINKTAPLYLRDVKEAIEEEGWEFAFIAGFPALFGVGVQTYKKKTTGTGDSGEMDYIDQLPEEIPDMSFMEAIDGYEESIPEYSDGGIEP